MTHTELEFGFGRGAQTKIKKAMRVKYVRPMRAALRTKGSGGDGAARGDDSTALPRPRCSASARCYAWSAGL